MALMLSKPHARVRLRGRRRGGGRVFAVGRKAGKFREDRTWEAWFLFYCLPALELAV